VWWPCFAPRCWPFPASPAEKTRRRRARRGRQAQEPRPGARSSPRKSGRLPRTVTVTGTLAADEEVVAGFKVPGRVSEIAVDLGSPVRKGQSSPASTRRISAFASNRPSRPPPGARRAGTPQGRRGRKRRSREDRAGARARAVLEEARLNRDRTARLSEKNFNRPVEVDASQSRLLVAESRYQAALEEIRKPSELLAERSSSLALARQQLSDAVLSAPIDGAVRERPRLGGGVLAAGASGVRTGTVHPAPPSGGGAGTGRTLRAGRAGGPGPAGGGPCRARRSRGPPEPVHPGAEPYAGRRAEVAKPGREASPRLVRARRDRGRCRPHRRDGSGRDGGDLRRPREGVRRQGRKGGGEADPDRRPFRGRVEILEGVAAGEPVVTDPGNLVGGTPVIVTR